MKETLPGRCVPFPQVTDMMLQDQNYPDWGVAARRFWKRGNNRIVLFWYVLSDSPVCYGCGGGGARLRAISASYYRRSISVLISLQSASAPLIRGNRWTRQGRGGALPAPPRSTGCDPPISAQQTLPTSVHTNAASFLQMFPRGGQKRRDVSDAGVEVDTWVSVTSQSPPPS